MKKILYGALPFLGLAFLVGCGPQPQPIDHKVNEEDFYKGVNFTNVQFMQLEYSNDQGQTGRCQFSPTVFFNHTEVAEERLYLDEFVAVQDPQAETFCKYTRNSKDAPYTYSEDLTRGEAGWQTPQAFDYSLSQFIGPNKITYSDFTFDTATNMYNADLASIGATGSFGLKFNNKKVVGSHQDVSMHGTTVVSDFTYSYNNFTPTLPPKPQA